MTLSASRDTAPWSDPPKRKISTTPPCAYRHGPLAPFFTKETPPPTFSLLNNLCPSTIETHPVPSGPSGRVRYEILRQMKPTPAPLRPMVVYFKVNKSQSTDETHPVPSGPSGRVRYELLRQTKPTPAPLRPMVVYKRKIHLLVITPTSYRATAAPLYPPLALAPGLCVLACLSLSLFVFSKVFGHS